MIDLQRLNINVGDVVKLSTSPVNGLEPVPFAVTRTEILNLVPMVYGTSGIGIPAATLIVVSKNTELTLSERNKIALEGILQAIFPDRWDIQDLSSSRRISIAGWTSSREGDHVVIIHFPEVEITNSRGNKHLIRDLYTSLALTANYRIRDTYIYGTRSTRTQEEIDSAYGHSHMSIRHTNNGIGWSSFCLGSGIINESLLIARGCEPSQNETNYELLFEALDSYVAWESIEGGPYARMNNISSREGRYRGNPHYWRSNEDHADRFLRILDKFGYTIPIEWSFGAPKIENKSSLMRIDTNEFKNSLREFLFSNIEILDKMHSLIEISKIIIEETDRRQALLSINLDMIKKLINNEEPIDKGSKDYVIIEEGNHNLVFRGVQVINKKLTKETTKIKLNDLHINDSLVKVLIDKFNFKFYAKLFNEEQGFIKKLTSDKTGL